MIAAKKYVFAGPLLDNGHMRGVTVLDVATVAEAETIMNADPAVQAGQFATEVHAVMLPMLDSIVVNYAT